MKKEREDAIPKLSAARSMGRKKKKKKKRKEKRKRKSIYVFLGRLGKGIRTVNKSSEQLKSSILGNRRGLETCFVLDASRLSLFCFISRMGF